MPNLTSISLTPNDACHMSRKTAILGLVISVFVIVALYFYSSMDEGVTPLMVAAKTGETEVVRELISEGVDLDQASTYGWTALMFAAWQGHEENVRALVEGGADTNVVSGSVPASFSTTGD